jgi:hypothetical protein
MCGPAYVLGRLCRAPLMSQAVYVPRRLGVQPRLCTALGRLCTAAYVLKSLM